MKSVIITLLYFWTGICKGQFGNKRKYDVIDYSAGGLDDGQSFKRDFSTYQKPPLLKRAIGRMYGKGVYSGPFNLFTGKPRDENEFVSAMHDIYYTAWSCEFPSIPPYTTYVPGDKYAFKHWNKEKTTWRGVVGQAIFGKLKKAMFPKFDMGVEQENILNRRIHHIHMLWLKNDFRLDPDMYKHLFCPIQNETH